TFHDTGLNSTARDVPTRCGWCFAHSRAPKIVAARDNFDKYCRAASLRYGRGKHAKHMQSQSHKIMNRLKLNGYSGYTQKPSSMRVHSVLLVAAVLGSVDRLQAADGDWPVYLGDKASTHFSTLKHINKDNVQRLQVAWTYRSGDAREDDRSQIQCNPLIIDGVLYGTSAQLKLLALDAATGRELWRFDPFADRPGAGSLGVNRGIVYWADGKDRRILFSAGQYLNAVDARTGKPIASFGQNGRVDIREGLGREASK